MATKKFNLTQEQANLRYKLLAQGSIDYHQSITLHKGTKFDGSIKIDFKTNVLVNFQI